MHEHDHDHGVSQPPATQAGVGSALLAMSAPRRLAAAVGVVLLLWAAVGWALSYDPAMQAAPAIGVRG
jgi:hypothetical protein